MIRRPRKRLRERKRLPPALLMPPPTTEQIAHMKKIRSINRQLGLTKIPRFLDRSKWTQKDWSRYDAAWAKVDEELAIIKRHQLRKLRKLSFTKRKMQEEKAARAEVRETKRAERMKRKAHQAIIDDRVISYLDTRCDTVNLLSKKLDLEMREVRQSLKRLLKVGKAIRTSPRRWAHPTKEEPKPKRVKKRLSKVTTTRQTRKRLSDTTTPRRRRKRL